MTMNPNDMIRLDGEAGDRGVSDHIRTLVVYDSPAGSTREVGEFIGEVLAESGGTVDVMDVSAVTDLASYHHVVVGGAIRYDRWVSGAARFVQRNALTLSTKPVAYFFTSMALSAGTEQAVRKGDDYARKLHELAPRVAPVMVGRFAGALDYSKLSAAPRLLLRVLMAVLRVEEGDYRDWEAIRSWTNEVAASIGRAVRKPSASAQGT